MPSGPRLLFAAPTQIWHYVTVHGYRPPDAFIEGVLNYDPAWPDGPWVPGDARREYWKGRH
ncbi:hypothetical protein J3R03_005358 [Actinoplanes couchii]|nr:hypothetical protein [Actinoplanes couchii]